MPQFLTEEQRNERNRSDALRIRNLMTHFLADVQDEQPTRRPDPNEPDNEEEDMEAHRRGRYVNLRDRVGDMLQMPDGMERKDIAMEDIMASADAQHNAVLKKPWYVRETSNRERVLARYLLDNVDTFIHDIPIRCKHFELLPIQRAAVLAMTSVMPVETYTQVEIPSDCMKDITRAGARKQAFDVTYNIEAGALPVFTIADVRSFYHSFSTTPTILTMVFDCLLAVLHWLWKDDHGGHGGTDAALQPRSLEPAQGRLQGHSTHAYPRHLLRSLQGPIARDGQAGATGHRLRARDHALPLG